jgi:hypothetical protein
MKSTTVRRATRRLVKLGLITCESQGKKTNLRYRVEYNKLVELSEAGKILCAERRKAKRESDSIDPKGYTATDSHRPQRVHDIDPKGPTTIDPKGPTTIDPKGPTTIDPKGPTELLSNYENKLLKELDANASKDSGSISGLETTLTMKPKTLPESEEQMLSILECQEELSKLTTRKDKAIVNGSFTPECPNMTAYNEINKQIQKWQQRLNLARGRAFQECQKTA